MSKPSIACFKSGSLPVQDGTLPDRLLVMPWGAVETNQGKVVCNEVTLAILASNQATAKYDRVALDFQHNTVPGTEHHKPEPNKVAAFGTPVIEEGKGIFLTNLEWTVEGKEHATGGHYPDLSPAVKRNERGEIYFMHSVALCRQGEIDGLTLFSATASIPNEDQLMKTDIKDLDPAAVRKTLNVFRAALGLAELAEDAAPDAVLSATTEAVDKIVALAKGTAAKTDEKKDDAITAMSARMDAMERQAIVTAATAQGKAIPLTAEQIAKTDITTLSAMVEKLTPTVPLGRKNPDTDITALSAEGKTSAEMSASLSRMGLSEEDFKKYGPKQ